jgi:hypothetical protein
LAKGDREQNFRQEQDLQPLARRQHRGETLSSVQLLHSAEDSVGHGTFTRQDKTRLLVVREVEVLAIAQEPTLLEDREPLDKVSQEETDCSQRLLAAVVEVELVLQVKLARRRVPVMEASG